MKIKTGAFEVFDSGSCISAEQEPVIFYLAENLKVRFSFLNDDESKTHRMEFNPISNQELEIKLFNFNNSLGTGTNNPLPIGTLNNRRLFLSFNIYAFNKNSSKTIHHCWYLGEEVNNG